MTTRGIAAAVLIFSVLPIVRAEDPKPADPLQPFGRFVGGAWESEGDFKVHVAYEWGINKKLLKIKSCLIGKTGPNFMYESVVYWHPSKKEVVFQSIGASGGLFEGVMSSKGSVFTSDFTSFEGDKSTQFRQTIDFQDDDHVLWTVFRKNGDEWVKLHEVKEHRVQNAESK
jgi:hypothetical protein